MFFEMERKGGGVRMDDEKIYTKIIICIDISSVD